LGDKVKKKEMDGACSTYGGEERCIRVVGAEPEIERPLVRPRLRLEGNIKMDLQEVDGGHRLDRSGSE